MRKDVKVYLNGLLTLATGFLVFVKIWEAGVDKFGIVDVVGLGDAVSGVDGVDAAADVTDTVVLDGRPEVVNALTKSWPVKLKTFLIHAILKFLQKP